MADVSNEQILRLVCEHTGQRVSLDLVQLDQYIAFARGAIALASRPAEVDDEGLPALPDPVRASSDQGYLGYTAEQFRQGQRDAREYQKKVDEKIIVRRDETIADLRFNIGELMKAVAPSHTTNKEK